MWQFFERSPRLPSLLFRLATLAIVPGPLGAGYEVHGGDGEALDRGIGGGDGTFDGHGEVVVQLRGCEGTGGLDDEGAGIAVERDGVGVGDIGMVVGGAGFKFERIFDGSPYFFY